jgi:hypothetical protein
VVIGHRHPSGIHHGRHGVGAPDADVWGVASATGSVCPRRGCTARDDSHDIPVMCLTLGPAGCPTGPPSILQFVPAADSGRCSWKMRCSPSRVQTSSGSISGRNRPSGSTISAQCSPPGQMPYRFGSGRPSHRSVSNLDLHACSARANGPAVVSVRHNRAPSYGGQHQKDAEALLHVCGWLGRSIRLIAHLCTRYACIIHLQHMHGTRTSSVRTIQPCRSGS